MLRENISRTPFVAVLLFHSILIVAAFLIWIGECLVKKIFRFNLHFLFYWLLLSYFFTKGISSGCIKIVRIESKILSVLFALVILVFSKGIIAIFIKKRRKKLLIYLTIISAIFTIISVVFLSGEGFKESKVETFLMLQKESTYKYINIEDAVEIDGKTIGPYQVETLSYGDDSLSSLESGEVNLSMYARNAEGLYGKYRKIVLKMDLNQAKLKGMIWYPEEKENCPILFIMHGNHTINETSHDGYGYLGEYLASYGYMVVSVDENILNTLSNENDARAILFLENMKMVEKYIEDESNVLYRKGDVSKIAVAGHSRGGESAAITYLFNQLEYYTENGMSRLTYEIGRAHV